MINTDYDCQLLQSNIVPMRSLALQLESRGNANEIVLGALNALDMALMNYKWAGKE